MADTDKNIVIIPNRGQPGQPNVIFTGNANVPMTLRVADDNSLSFENLTGQMFSISNNLTSGTIFSVTDISGIPFLSVNASGNVSLVPLGGANVGIGTSSPQTGLDVYGNVRVTANAATTGVNTGALVVTGNVGIGGNINIGQSIAVTNATQQFSIRINGAGQLEFIPNQFASAAGTPVLTIDDDSAGLIVTSNLSVARSASLGNLSITNTTQSTSTVTGAIINAGGMGMAGNLFVGGSINGANVNVTGTSAPPNGIWLPTTNTLGFSTGSSERMRIDSLGNLSLGTTAVFYPTGGRTGLSISGTSQSILALGTGGTAAGYLSYTGSTLDVGTTVVQPVRMLTNSIERLRVDTAGNVGIGTATPLGNLHVMGNVWLQNNAAFIGGIRFPDGSFLTTAAAPAFSASNVTVTSTSTNATFYPAFVENTTGNLGIRIDTGFTYNPSTETLVLQALNSAAATALGIDSGTTGALNIGTGANAKNITIGNSTGATRLFVNAGTAGTTFHTVAGGFVRVQATAAPTVDMFQIANTGFPVATSGISALQINYIGGAAAVESSAARTDLTPSGTPGSTWNGFRAVGNAAPAGVVMNAIKVDNITAAAGSNNALWLGSGWGNLINLGNSVLIRGDGSYAGSVNNINVVSTATNATFYPAFFENTTGALAPRIDTALTYNPGTDALTAGQFVPSVSTVPANGMFLPDANSPGFASNSIERMRINASGNVGIGTATPLGNLHVMGNIWLSNNAAFIGGIRFPDGTFQQTAFVSTTAVRQSFTATGGQTSFTVAGGYTPGQIDVYYNGVKLLNGTEVTVSSGTAVVLVTPATAGADVDVVAYPAMVIADAVRKSGDTMTGDLSISPGNLIVNTDDLVVNRITGFVGINTTSPNQTLDVNGAALFRSNAQILSATQATTTSTGSLITAGGIGAAGNLFVGGSINGANVNVTGANVPPNGMFLPAANQLGFSTNSVEKIRVDASGNFSIGTTAPPYSGAGRVALTVNASLPSVFLTRSNINRAYFAYDGTNTSLFSDIDGGSMTVGTGTANSVIFATNFTERMRIDGNGNVGIGTSTPLGNLHVMGNIFVANSGTAIGGIRFPDGTFQTTAAAGGGGTSVTLSNDTTTNAPRFLSFASATSGTLSTLFTASPALQYYPLTSNIALSGNLSVTNGVQLGNLSVTNSTASTSNTTGALIVSGGAGISGNIYSGGNLSLGLANNSNRIGIVAGTSQTAIYAQSAATAGDFLLFQDSNPITRFRIDSTGTIATGTWNGTAITAPFGGTGFSSYTAGDLLYANSTNSLARIAIAGTGVGTGNVLLNNGSIPTWGSVSNIRVTSTTTAATFYPSFFESTSGNVSPRIDPEFTYVPGASRVTAGSFEPFSTTVPPNGIFRPAANTLGLATNSGEKIRIDSLGNVSIGTTAVNYASANRTVLTLSGTSESLLSFAVAGSARGYLRTDGTSMVLQSDTGDTLLYTGGTGAVVLGTRSIARVRVDASGNVGIGTATPLGNLHVMGNIWLSNNAAFIGGIRFPDGTFQTTAAAGGGGTTVTLSNDTTTNAPRFLSFASATSGTLSTLFTASPALQYYPLTSNIALSGNLTVTNSAQLGNLSVANTTVSTSTTTGALIVQGGVGVVGNVFAGRIATANSGQFGNIGISNTTQSTSTATGAVINQGGMGIAGNLFVGGSINGANVNVTGSAAPPNGMWLPTTSTLAFSTGSSERMRFDNLGNLSIGTTSVGFAQGNRLSVTVNGTSESLITLFTGGAAQSYWWSSSNNQFLVAQQGTLSITTITANPMVFNTNNLERVRITATGTVGVGTATPLGNLHVMGNVWLSNSAAFIGGIRFPDGTFQQTAPRTVQTTFTFTTVNNTTTTFALSPYTSTNSYIQVFVNGVYQPTNTWSWSTTNLVLNQPAPNGATVEVTVYTSLDLTAGNNSVTTTSTSTNATFYPVFTAATSGVQGVNADGDLTYNPSTNLLSVGAINVTGTTVPANGMFLPATNTLAFSAGSAEDMRIDSTGNVAIGSTSTTLGRLYVTSASNLSASPILRIDDPSTSNGQTVAIYAQSSAAGAGIGMYGNGATTPNKYIRVNNGIFQIVNSAYTAVPLQLTDSGNLSVTGEVTAYSSDARLKGNIAVIDNAVSKIRSIRGVMFDWLPIVHDLGFEPAMARDVGVIAQEVEKILPEVVRPAPFDRDMTDPTRSKSGENYLTVQYEKLTALLIEAVKEQQAMIEKQESRIASLEAFVGSATQGSIQ